LIQADRNIVEAPIRDADEVKFIKITRKRAEEYWKQVCLSSGHAFSQAYHEGFVEGFVDYVEAGGSGEPPFLPPFRYRLSHFRTPEGIALVEDWYAGFRNGSSVARASGLRDLSLIPLPNYAVPKDLNEDSEAPAAPRPLAGQPKATIPEALPPLQPGTLPMPRPTPPIPSGPFRELVPEAPPPRPIEFPFGAAPIPWPRSEFRQAAQGSLLISSPVVSSPVVPNWAPTRGSESSSVQPARTLVESGARLPEAFKTAESHPSAAPEPIVLAPQFKPSTDRAAIQALPAPHVTAPPAAPVVASTDVPTLPPALSNSAPSPTIEAPAFQPTAPRLDVVVRPASNPLLTPAEEWRPVGAKPTGSSTNFN
jgi:hypothetical protein